MRKLKKKDKPKNKAPDETEQKKENKKEDKKTKKDVKGAKNDSKDTSSEVMVKFGKPVIQVNFKRIKSFVVLFVVAFIIIAIVSVDLLVTAIKIRSSLGAFINMISSGDGEVLPTFLALPIFLIFLINVTIVVFVYKLFSSKKSPGFNNLLFIFILIALVLIILCMVAIFATLGHVYGANKVIENGIIKAMEKYTVNSLYKKQMDRLQIEFQCCGSKKYEDWYNITWIEKVLSTNTSVTQSGKIPFSCCAIKSKFPCIHYDIEKTGINYLYTPEFNLSVSATGCYTKVMEKKQQVGWGIIASLLIIIFLELLLLLPARFLQTGHSATDYKFEGNSRTYTVWLLGMYTGKNQANGPPEPPPVPPELMT